MGSAAAVAAGPPAAWEACETGVEQQPGGRKRTSIGVAAMMGKKQKKPHRAHAARSVGAPRKRPARPVTWAVSFGLASAASTHA